MLVAIATISSVSAPEIRRGITVANLDHQSNNVIVARGRLADARRWFAYLGWEELPPTERGKRILKWDADHARLASPANPKRSVRRWVRRWAPWLTARELDDLAAACEQSNKRWSADQCASALEITMHYRSRLGLRFIGANDDTDYEIRSALKRANAAARARKCRSAKSTGAKRGRPKSEGPKPWQVLGISKPTYFRWRKAGKIPLIETGMKSGRKPLISRDVSETENASRHISKNRKRDGISVSHDIGAATLAVAGTPSPISPMAQFDGAAVVGNPESDRQLKTRFPTTMKLSKAMIAWAREAGFEPEKIGRMWQMFRDHKFAQRTYSADWEDFWYGWVNREVDIYNAWHERERAWLERRAA
jgi:hypothetical protein